MIKRRFYKLEHDDKDSNNILDSSSSSSSDDDDDSDVEETEEYDNVAVTPPVTHDDNLPRPTSSGYESDDSSANAVDVNSSEDNEAQLENDVPNLLTDSPLRGKGHADILERQFKVRADKGSVPADVPGCILKCRSVFKCRLCPRIVCLTEETLNTHLKSKRHTRSEKLLKEGRLKQMLNSDGEIEEDGETHEERHARFEALAQDKGKSKKNKGRQRQRERSRKKKMGKKLNTGNGGNVMQSTEKPAKKRRKSDN